MQDTEARWSISWIFVVFSLIILVLLYHVEGLVVRVGVLERRVGAATQSVR
jgi:hypothetical protein